MKRIIKIFIALCIMTLIIPIKVNAAGGTYINLLTTYTDILKYRTSRIFSAASNYDVRCVYLIGQGFSNNQGWVYFVTDASNRNVTVKYTVDGQAYTTNLTYSKTSGSNTYYYNWINFTGSSDVVNEIYIPNATVNSNIAAEKAIDYTYGDMSVDPVPDPSHTYGTLKDLSFSTALVGAGNGTGDANKDIISWYPYADSDNQSFGASGQVQIRVVPGEYVAGTRADLLDMAYDQFVLYMTDWAILDTVQAYSGKYEVTWGQVMQLLNFRWPSLQILLDGEYWKKKGWVYQVRYQFEEDVDTENWSEWQNVYNITSSSPKGTQGLDPSDGTALPSYYNDVKDSFNTTSVVNNNYNVTNYINNVPFVTNPSTDQEPPSGGSNFWDWIGQILSSLLDLVGTIGGWIADLIGAVLGLAGDIINGFLGLFHIPDFTINNYNTEVQTIKQNSGIFGQAVDFTTDVKTQLDTISTSPQDLVFTFPGISIMNTQIIPEVNGSYTQIVSDLGLSDFHNLVYLCTDGFVIISLIVLVYRKLMEVLKK